MRFGSIPIHDAQGAILAHSLKAGSVSFKKGRLLSAADVAALAAAGCMQVVAARLEDADLGEDAAAGRIAHALCAAGVFAHAPFTGRTNLYAEHGGLLVYARDWLDRINLVDESVTVAALPPFQVVQARQLVATVKIIPYGVAAAVVEAAERAAANVPERIRVAPFQPAAVGFLQTELAGTSEGLLDRTRRTLDARLARYGSRVTIERRCAHDAEAVAAALAGLHAAHCDPILVSGASATADRRDVVPAGIVRAGGEIVHLGMPVEPGNLLVYGRMAGATAVICLPGCARSPAPNGFDWVLERVLAGVPPTREDIMRMGAGGYIKGARVAGARTGAQGSREPPVEQAASVAAIVLAAGRSTRMRGANKLLATIDGEPMIRRTVRALLASQARPVLVVTGHEADAIRSALDGLAVGFVDNPDFGSGMSTSLRRGIAALPAAADGVLVCLADMPWTDPADIDRLIGAFAPAEHRGICVPVHGGRRGNPVLFARTHFPEVMGLTGDVGARALLDAYPGAICEVPMPADSVLRDVDSPEALRAQGRDPI
ncbi:MAG: NTP transferase domain-containing protein [Gammaproteobacteria bacterium]